MKLQETTVGRRMLYLLASSLHAMRETVSYMVDDDEHLDEDGVPHIDYVLLRDSIKEIEDWMVESKEILNEQ